MSKTHAHKGYHSYLAVSLLFDFLIFRHAPQFTSVLFTRNDIKGNIPYQPSMKCMCCYDQCIHNIRRTK